MAPFPSHLVGAMLAMWQRGWWADTPADGSSHTVCIMTNHKTSQNKSAELQRGSLEPSHSISIWLTFAGCRQWLNEAELQNSTTSPQPAEPHSLAEPRVGKVVLISEEVRSKWDFICRWVKVSFVKNVCVRKCLERSGERAWILQEKKTPLCQEFHSKHRFRKWENLPWQCVVITELQRKKELHINTTLEIRGLTIPQLKLASKDWGESQSLLQVTGRNSPAPPLHSGTGLTATWAFQLVSNWSIMKR